MITRQHIGNIERNCSNCKYWDDFTGICWNGDSDERADFTDGEFVCKWYEAKEAAEGEDKAAHREY